MNCAKCDAENLDSAKFCKQCGCKLNEKETGQTKQNIPNKFSSGKNKYIIIAVVVLGLFGAGASAMFLKDGRIDLKSFRLNFFEEEGENDSEQTEIDMPEKSEELDNKDSKTNSTIDKENNTETIDTEDLSFDNDLDQLEKKEDSEIATIKKYYSFLSNNNLEEAYQMRFDKTAANYEEFKDWYEGAQYLKPDNFNKINSSSYQFYVEYKDRNNVITNFKVETMVIGDKIETLSSIEVNEKQEKQSQDNDILKVAKEYAEEYISGIDNAGIDNVEIQIKKDTIALVYCSTAIDSQEMEPLWVIVELENNLWKAQKVIVGYDLQFLPCDYPDLYSEKEVDECKKFKEKFTQ